MPGLFLVYEKVASGLARITSSATVVDAQSHAALLESRGEKYYYVPLDGYAGYFVLGEDDEIIAIANREQWSGGLAKQEVLMLETAVLPDLPAARVRVVGPTTERFIDHPGGDLLLRMSIPGEYIIGFEAFPLLPYEARLTVRPIAMEPASGGAGPSLPTPEETGSA